MAVTMWDVVDDRYQRFGGTYCSHLQSRRVAKI
jgi:hypothetical protein